MTRSEAIPDPLPSSATAAREYLFDMIKEMAALARRFGEPAVAIHLEAILAARRATGRAATRSG